jgi:hypothetical protein
MKWKFIPGICAATAVLLMGDSLHAQVLLPQLKKGDAAEAMNNARQIGLCLLEFELEYGGFPSDASRAAVEEATGVTMPAADKTSNSLLRQLFAAGIIQNEAAFFAKVPGVKKGDGVIVKEKALEQGENAFAYVAGLSTAGNPGRPILLCPLVPGTTTFDPKPFGGKALVLRLDNSVQMLTIEKDGTVKDKGVDLLSSEHPVWGGKAPDIRHADLLPKEEVSDGR